MKKIFTFWAMLILSTFLGGEVLGQQWKDVLEMHYCNITDIKVDSEGNKIIGGTSNGLITFEGDTLLNISLSTNYNSYEKMFFVAKISESNELIWIKYGSAKTQKNFQFRNVNNVTFGVTPNEDYLYVLFEEMDGLIPNEFMWNGATYAFSDYVGELLVK